eukprot:jgi/Astpho2/9502/fgenesh1_pg.00145_%23_86_t
MRKRQHCCLAACGILVLAFAGVGADQPALPDWFMPLVPVAASSTSGASTASATISTPSDSSTVSPNATSNGTTSSTVLLSSVSGSYSSEKQRQAIAAALGLQPYSAPAADAVVIKSSESNSSSVDLTSLDVAGSSFSSEQQRQEVAGLQGLKPLTVSGDRSGAAAAMAGTMSIQVISADSISSSALGVAEASTAAAPVATFGRNPHSEVVSSVPESILLVNPYQSSSKNAATNPASAAIDGNPATVSLTDFDTAECPAINVEGKFGACGMLGNCLDSPNYITNAYLSSPSNPFWTAEFSANLTVPVACAHPAPANTCRTSSSMEEALNLSRAGVILDQLSPELIKGRNVQALHLHMGTAHQASYQVTQVQLMNRQDCCRCPLADARIYIGDPSALDLAQTVNPLLSQETDWQLCAEVPAFSATSPAPIFDPSYSYTQTFACNSTLVGKAVAVQLEGETEILSLAEISVSGVAL